MSGNWSYDADVDARSYTRLFREEADMALSAMDCLLLEQKAVYASSEITTGKAAYGRVADLGLRTLRDLPEREFESIVAGNLRDAIQFARSLRSRLPTQTLVISPAPFRAAGWTQAEYLLFWQTLIQTRIGAVYFRADWQYSNGCAFEFATAIRLGIPTFDHSCNALSQAEGLAMLEQAAAEVRGKHIDVSRLEASIESVSAHGAA